MMNTDVYEYPGFEGMNTRGTRGCISGDTRGINIREYISGVQGYKYPGYERRMNIRGTRVQISRVREENKYPGYKEMNIRVQGDEYLEYKGINMRGTRV